MTMRNRSGGCILDRAPAAELDPGNLCLPIKQPKAERQCHCPAKTKRNHLNGMRPMLDLDAGIVRCGLCSAPIGPSCRTREVMWLRSLLSLAEKHPEQFDAASIPDKIYRS